MTSLRRFLARQRQLAVVLVAAALAVRLLVPAGYMPAPAGGLALMICPGHVVAAPMPGMHHGHTDGHEGERDKAGQPCAFAGMALPTLASVPPMVPASIEPRASTPILASAAPRAPPAPSFLQPPLRGPPAIG